MKKSIATFDASGDIVVQEIPEHVADELITTMKETQARLNAGEHIDDDDCPVCQLMREAGLDAGPIDKPEAPHNQFPRNRAERRALASLMRNKKKRNRAA